MLLFSRSWALVCAGAIALPFAAYVPQAFAQESTQEKPRDFQIPAGPLAAALNRFASESGLALVYPAELARGRRTSGISGAYTRRLALEQLLAGTSLTYRFSDDSTVVIEPAAKPDTRVLGPVRVEGANELAAAKRGEGVASLGGVRGHQTDEAVGYRARVATVAAGAPTPIEDIPRSISVMTQDQIQAQDISDIGEALRHLPGITLIDVQDGQSPVERGSAIYSRGQTLERAQVDGGASTRLNIGQGGILDLGPYERIELLRGPNGVFVGGDNAGGTLNFVRKRPGIEPALQVAVIGGRWDRYSASVDYSTPSVAGTGVGFRGVLSGGYQQFFYDDVDKKNGLLYGIFDVPLTPSAHLEFGGTLSRVREHGRYVGLPRFVEGEPIPFSRNTNLAPDWHHQYLDSADVFARINADVSEDWQLQGGVSLAKTDVDAVTFSQQSMLSQATGTILPGATGSRFLSQFEAVKQDAWTADLKLTGRADTWLLRHNLLVAADLSEETSHGSSERAPLDYFNKPILTVADLTSAYPKPALMPEDAFAGTTRGSRIGVTLSDTVSVTRYLDLTATARRYEAEGSNVQPSSVKMVLAGTPGSVPVPNRNFAYLDTGLVESTYVGRYKEKPTWRPTFAAVVKPLEGLSAFATHAEGSSDQSNAYSRSGPLDPSTFENREFGVKYGNDTWLATLTHYRVVSTNSARTVEPLDLSCGPGGTAACYYLGGDTQKSTGIDFEVTGSVLPGLEVIASYNYNNSVTTKTQAPLQTRAPSRMAKTFISWRPAWLPRASVQAGASWQGRVYVNGRVNAVDDHGDLVSDASGQWIYVPYEYAQDAYVLYDLGGHYQLNDTTDLSLLIENLTDKAYFVTPDNSTNHVGRPRNFTLTMRWAPWKQRAYAPGGDPGWLNLDGWYVAGDFGRHTPDAWSATSSRAKSDGSRADWSFETDDDFLLSGRVGYRLGTHWRAEAEAAYRPGSFGRIADASSVAPTGICDVGTYSDPGPRAPACRKVPGSLDVYTLLGNAIFDFRDAGSRFRPYVGVGVGLARASISGVGRYDAPEPAGEVGGNTQSTRFAWQLQAGLAVAINEHLGADLSYRYLGIPDVQLETYAVDPWLGTFEGDYADQAFSAGLRWTF